MLYQKGQKVVVAYCLENKYGESPCYIDGKEVVYPEGYKCAFMNPTRLYEIEYRRYFYHFYVYEYVLNLTALIYDTGEVVFRPDDVLSKTKMRRWLKWQHE